MLFCYTNFSKHDVIRMAVEYFPAVCLPVAFSMCSSFSDWSFLVQELLAHLKPPSRRPDASTEVDEKDASQNAAPQIDCNPQAAWWARLPPATTWRSVPRVSAGVYLRLYQAVLSHVVHVLRVDEYFQLVPDEGSTQFFLPYLRRAFMASHAKQLRQDLVRQAIEFEAVEDATNAIRVQQSK